jgi:4-hydroxybenzoate polyprenyltransferase
VFLLTGVFLRIGNFDILNKPRLAEIGILAVYSIFTLVFFVTYAFIFEKGPSKDKYGMTEDDKEDKGKMEGYFLLFSGIIIILLPINFAIIAGVRLDDISTITKLIYLFGVWVINLLYAILLYKNKGEERIFKFRYEIYFPVLLLICINFFTGNILYADDFNPLLGLTAILILSLAYFFIRKSSTKLFALVSLAFLCAIAISFIVTSYLWVMDWLSLTFKTLLISVILGLYLGGYELWRATSLILYHKERCIIADIKTKLTEEDINNKHENSFKATLFASTVVVLLFPLVFVFSDFGVIFLFATLGLSLGSFLFWYYLGNHEEWKKRWKFWSTAKVIGGFAFILILYADTFYNPPLMINYYPSNLSSITANFLTTLIGGIAIAIILKFLYRVFRKEGSKKTFVIKALPNKTYIFEMGTLITAALLVISLLIYDTFNTNNVIFANKAAIVCYCYFLLLIVQAVLSIIQLKRDNEPKIISKVFPRILGYIQTLRVHTGLVIFLSIFLVGLFKGFGFQHSFLLSLPVTLIAMGGFAVNDFFDKEKDSINAPHRAIPSGRLNPKEALGIGIISLFAGSLIAVICCTPLQILITGTTLILVILYSKVSMRAPMLKNAWTAVLCITPVIFDIVSFKLDNAFWLVVVACFVFNLGRELLMDLKDLVGDTNWRILTIPARIGPKKAFIISFILMLSSSLFFAPFLLESPNLYRLIGIIAFLVSIFGAILVWGAGRNKNRQWLAVEVLKLPMLSAIVIVIS